MSPEAAEPKVCAKCKAKNSPAKNYCDHCGTPLMASETQASGPREIPLTIRVDKKVQPEGGAFNLPLAGRVDRDMDNRESAPITGSKTQKKRTTSSRTPRAPIAIPWALLILLAIGGALAWQYHAYTRPERSTVRAAQEYLELLARSNFPQAYAMLSVQAQANCDIGLFQTVNQSPPASWSGLKLARLDGDTALLKFNGGSLFLSLEDGRWMVPFNLNFLAKASQAISRHDPDMAVLSAQSAVSINPRDPMSRGLLCEAYLEHRMPEEALKECALAVELSGKFGLEPQGLDKWRQIAGGR